ncbi:MAG: CDP-glycerol glycerophosphotransferase family protein [Promethearchaeia archaeon]
MIETKLQLIFSKIKRILFNKILKIKTKYVDYVLIHYISLFIRGKVDDKLIVLGSANGKAFIGNTKYIYEFLKDYDYKLIWFSKSRILSKELKERGIEFVEGTSLRSIKTLRRAKYIFLTHGLTDILPIRFSKKTIIIQTWHGVQNKRNRTETEYVPYPKLTKILRLKIRNNEVYNYFITPSGTKKDLEIICRYFQIPKEKVLTTGYPRNDIFFSYTDDFIKKIKTQLKIPNNVKRIFLYAPTFRDNKLKAEFPLSEKEISELNQILQNTNSLLILKAHINDKVVNFKDFSNFLIFKQEMDIQELLIITDVLITDYSSVYCDFLLLDRPILFFTYDFDDFLEKGRGFYYDFKKIAPGPLLYTGRELIEAIKNISEINQQFKKKREEAIKIYHKYRDGKSTERLLKYLKII